MADLEVSGVSGLQTPFTVVIGKNQYNFLDITVQPLNTKAEKLLPIFLMTERIILLISIMWQYWNQ